MVTFSIQEGFETAGGGIAPLDNAVRLLQDFGFFKVVLPFLLIWALVYAVILKTKILGDPETATSKNAAGIIATVLGFVTITYTPVVEALQILLPQASFLLVVALLVIMTLAFIVPKWQTKMDTLSGGYLAALGIFVLIIFLGIVGFAVGDSIPALQSLSLLLSGTIAFAVPQEAMNTLIALGLVLGIPLAVIFFMTRDNKATTPPAQRGP